MPILVENPSEVIFMAKVRTLTDQQYNDYLMALKDERPTMLIDKDGKRRPQR